jgi:isoleucyl-tRNA synthetase
VTSLAPAQAAALAAGHGVALDVGGESVALEAGDVVVQRTPREGLFVAAEGSVIVAVETALTPELVAEGLAREFVSKVQGMRKDADFDVVQRIAVTFEADDEVAAALAAHRAYVMAETLALACDRGAAPAGAAEVDLNGHACRIAVRPAQEGAC